MATFLQNWSSGAKIQRSFFGEKFIRFIVRTAREILKQNFQHIGSWKYKQVMRLQTMKDME